MKISKPLNMAEARVCAWKPYHSTNYNVLAHATPSPSSKNRNATEKSVDHFSPFCIFCLISRPFASALAAPCAFILPPPMPLIWAWSSRCSVEEPSLWFSFFDLPEKAPETAPKILRFSPAWSLRSASLSGKCDKTRQLAVHTAIGGCCAGTSR